MKTNVTLETLHNNQIQNILEMIYKDETLKDTFGTGKDRISRLMNSSYAAIIKNNNTSVGFIMMTDPKGINVHEIDLGILKEYKKNGYGSEALRLLKEKIIEQQVKISIQIRKINIPAIKTVIKNGFSLYHSDKKYNYYNLQNNTTKKLI